MQTQQKRFRYRGWRQSSTIVEIIHSVPTDLKTVMSTDYANQVLLDTTENDILTLSETVVSKIQHTLVQITYRLRSDE